MPCPRTGVVTPSQKYSGVRSRDPNGKKYRGGGPTPKKAFSRLWEPSGDLPPQPRCAHPRPNHPRTPASRASVKGRDSAVVMEPDGPQIDASSAAATEQPARLPRLPLPPTTPWCRTGLPALAPHGRPTTRDAACRRAGGCRLPGAARVLAQCGNHAPACKKKLNRKPQTDRAPLSQRPRAAASPHPHQVHCTYHSRGHRRVKG